MAIEIERKFLVNAGKITFDTATKTNSLRQYYIKSTPDLSIRLRMENNQRVILAIKSGSNPMEMNEFEFELPFEEYENRRSEMVGIEINKTRYYVDFDNRTWEIDVFAGALDGLIVAEIECDDAADIVKFPEWVTAEVTFDANYKNAQLALNGLSNIELNR